MAQWKNKEEYEKWKADKLAEKKAEPTVKADAPKKDAPAQRIESTPIVKKCPHCAMMIPREARVCPHCRKQQGLSSGMKFILGLILFLIIMAWIGSMSRGPGNGSSSSMEDRAFTAWAMHSVFIKNTLKAPSTADFAPKSESSVETVGPNTYKITSHVDAQNSFGAKIRNHYEITLKDNGPDKWQLIDLKFY